MSSNAPTWCLIALMLLLSPGCQEDPETPQIRETLNQTLNALESADWEALWDLSAPAGQQVIVDLHQKIHEAQDGINRFYPEEARTVAAAAAGRDVVTGIPSDATNPGPLMLARLLSPHGVRLDEKVRAGIASTRPIIDDDKAVLHTPAGEAYTFNRTQQGWRSRLIIDVLETNRNAVQLEDQVDAVLKAVNARREAWRNSRDAATAQGTFNLLQDAHAEKPINGRLIYSLVSQAARDGLLEALETGRKAQALIQERTPRAERQSAYDTHGLSLFVEATSDEDLLTRWLRSAEENRLVAYARVATVEENEGGNTAHVLTDQGHRVGMLKEGGLWRLEDATPVLNKALRDRARSIMSGLQGNGRADTAR